ncbi:MAG: sugar transferase [Phycisphaerales bacterium]|nr:sugar transferase [Phycisphaerales bacterium]
MRLGLVRHSPARVEDFRSLRDLYTPRQMAGLLQRERARADRHEREFALVVLRLRNDAGEWSILRLARVLLDVARTTDEVGRYDDDAVACILPDTDAGGAWFFARRACSMARRRGLDPICTVYAYPSAWTPGEEDDRLSVGRRGPSRGKAPSADSFDSRLRDEIPPSDDQDVAPLAPMFVRPTPWWKRLIDVVAASCGVVVLSPVLLAVAALIKVTDPQGPVLFKQRRAGLGGKPFTIYKFRTMRTDAEAMKRQLAALNEQDGPAFKITNDPRVTPIGRFLRRTSLDELPQLFNVLKGDMSLVGPRPLPVEESDGCDRWHRRRLDVAPGLTCIWQVHGRSRVTFDEWARMDIRYIRRRRLWHDLSLLVQTIPAVLLRRGAK